jgi:type I restriction enzyme M protein
MIGAILGDIIGSRHEFIHTKTKDFKLMSVEDNFITDDTYMTIAITKAILQAKDDFDHLSLYAKEAMLHIGNKYPSGYGTMFRRWLKSDDPQPYGSYGNGSAMRVSACGFYYQKEEDVIRCSDEVTKVTHNHPEGMKAARVTALSIFYLRNGMSKYEFKKIMSKEYNLFDNLDKIRQYYTFTEDAKYTMKPAILAFLESTDFIDAIRNAVSVGGDSDTIAAITGSLAQAYYGIPKEVYIQLEPYVYHEELIDIINQFEKKVPTKFEIINKKERPLITKR